MGDAGVGVDAQFGGGGLLAAEGDVALGQGGVGRAAVAARLCHRHASAEVRGAAFGGRLEALGLAAVAATDAARACAVLHLVLQVAEGQALRGQCAVGRIGAGDRTADQVYRVRIDVVTAIPGEEPGLLPDPFVAAFGLARAGIAAGVPGRAEGHLHASAGLAVLGHAFGQVLQRLDGECAASLHIDAVGRGRGATQGRVAIGLERDVPTRQRGVLPGGAVRIGLAAARTGFGIHVHTGLGAHRHAHAHLDACVVAAGAVGDMRLACLQQDVSG